MKILDQYIKRSVLGMVLVVALALCGIALFINVLGEINHIGTGQYNVADAFVYTLLKLPNTFYIIFPMIGLIGCLLGLGFLSTNNELTIMRASGLSVMQISHAVMTMIIVMCLLVSICCELLIPYCNQTAEHFRNDKMNNQQLTAVAGSLWLKQQQNFIRIEQVQSGKQLTGVTIYQFNNQHQLRHIIAAKNASFHRGQWLLYQVKENNISPTGVSVNHYQQLNWHIEVNPKILSYSSQKTDQMSMWQLWQLLRSNHASGVNIRDYQVAFWQRLFRPLSMIVMMFIAIPFVFGSHRQYTIGFKIVLGVIVGYGFTMLTYISDEAAKVSSLPPYLTTAMPLLIFGLIALLLVYRLVR